PQTSASFEGISRVYTLAGSITYPESGEPYKRMLDSSMAAITKMKETNDRKGPVVILQSCKDLAGSEEEAAKAVAQLAEELHRFLTRPGPSHQSGRAWKRKRSLKASAGISADACQASQRD